MNRINMKASKTGKICGGDILWSSSMSKSLGNGRKVNVIKNDTK